MKTKNQILVHHPRFIPDELTRGQQLSYNRVIKGLGSYSEHERAKLSAKDRGDIIYKSNLAWEIINEMKQDRLNTALTMVLRKFVPGLTGNAAALLTEPIFDREFQVDEIEELKIPRAEIIAELIKQKVLPQNFYQL